MITYENACMLIATQDVEELREDNAKRYVFPGGSLRKIRKHGALKYKVCFIHES